MSATSDETDKPTPAERAGEGDPGGQGNQGERGVPSSAAGGQGRDTMEPPFAPGELCCGGVRWPLSGRVLHLMVWLAARQQRINEMAAESGQLWITWKGNGPRSIDGAMKTRLPGE
jgi:hypothetical protein